MTAAGLTLVFLALAMFIPSLLERYWPRNAAERDRADRAETFAQDALDDLFRATAQADHYRHLYHDAVKTNAALLAHIGDEREAAAWQALAETPEWFAAKAAAEAARADYDLFDLTHEEER